jgi:hypothetical protein
MNFDTVFEILAEHGREDKVIPSPRAGLLRICAYDNDVLAIVDELNGPGETARQLGVTTDEIERWIDEHYVPQPYASRITELSGDQLCAVQEAPFYVSDGRDFWPHKPTLEQRKAPDAICVFRPDREKLSGV